MTQALFVLLSVVFFISDDTITFGTNVNQVFVVIRYAVYSIVLVSLLFSKTLRGHRLEQKSWIYAGLMVFAFILSMASNVDVRNGYFLQALVMVLAFVLARYVDRSAFLISYSRYLYWLACISLLIFASSVVLRPLVDVFPTTVNYGGVEFSNLFVGAVFKDAEILRNTSVFREPGVYALYLSVGIAIELLYKNAPCYRYLGVFFLALLTTFSTAGFAIAGVLLIAYLVKQKNIKVVFFAILLAACVAIMLYNSPDLSEQAFSKFSEDSTEFASTLARVSSVSVPSLIFAHSPVFGVGLTKFVDQYFIYSEELFGFPISPEGSSTNTVINTFAIYGILLGGLVALGLLRFANLLAGSRPVAFFVFIALLMMVSAQELRFSLFFNVLIMLGLIRVRYVAAETGDAK